MARRSLYLTGPASSTGSPMTLMMRPSVPSPTGTVIGPPLSLTSWPRTRPSVESMATVRTVDSPKCCATSSTRRLPWLSVSSALRIAGRSPWNCTSTTAPITCETCPVGLAMMSSSRKEGGASQRLGAGDDLDQLFGDHRLARAVVAHGLPFDHVAGVAGGIVHRRHARALLGGRVLQQRPEHLHGDVERQELGQDVFLVGFVFVDRAAGVASLLRGKYRRDDLLRGRNLGDDRLEPREEQGADVERALGEQPGQLFADGLGVLEFQHAHRAQVHRLQDLTAVLPPQLLEALAADAEELDLLALGDERAGALAGKPHDRRVERPAQYALGRAHDQQVHLLASGAGEQFWRPFEADDAARDIAEHLVHVLG